LYKYNPVISTFDQSLLIKGECKNKDLF